MIHIKELGKHIADCYAIKNYRNGTWGTPWCLGEHVFASFYGNTDVGGSHSWLRFRCNCTGCPAALMVKELDVLVLVWPPRPAK